jgi:hypothetical protein
MFSQWQGRANKNGKEEMKMKYFTFIVFVNEADSFKMTFKNFVEEFYYRDVINNNYYYRIVYMLDTAPKNVSGFTIVDSFESDRYGNKLKK